ncbi:MAG: hypothetical protein KIT33_07225 [Candidatus Kapabacteria bacterium]|nr:hypothetical protein [Ignavibacteriota bacterium]MCW5884746.1 hypothetical protein [Candidatus Kapabacteria bacterium]
MIEYNIHNNIIIKNKKVLFICGTMNTTTMLHAISRELSEMDCYFTHMYADGLLDFLAKKDLLNFVPLSGPIKQSTVKYFQDNNLKIDYYGKANDYDLVVTCTDLIIPRNIKNTKIVHVQEGMTDPEDLRYLLVKYFKFPQYLASTSVMGLSDEYDIFCVASEGYKAKFIKKGVRAEKIRVTGIPNYDNCKSYTQNNFPHRNFVLVATSDARETFKYENRSKFIKNAIKIADGRQLIFKLHPNEKVERATREIKRLAPDAIVYSSGNIHEMIANCDVLITKYSTVVYTGIALGKEVLSEIDIDELISLSPLQNGGSSAVNIANECRILIGNKVKRKKANLLKFQPLKPIRNAFVNLVASVV